MSDGPLHDPAGLLDRRLIEIDFHSEFEICRGRLCSDVPAGNSSVAGSRPLQLQQLQLSGCSRLFYASSMKKELHLIACSLVALYPFSAQALSSTPQVPTPSTMAALVVPNEYPLVGLGILSTLFLNVSPARGGMTSHSRRTIRR